MHVMFTYLWVLAAARFTNIVQSDPFVVARSVIQTFHESMRLVAWVLCRGYGYEALSHRIGSADCLPRRAAGLAIDPRTSIRVPYSCAFYVEPI